MPPTNSLTDAERLIAAVTEAQGRPPKVLTNILATADLLNAQSAITNPAKRIVDAGADGTLTPKRLADLVAQAAHEQMIATYIRDLQQHVEPLLMRRFHAALKDRACDDLIDSLRPVWNEHAEAIAAARAVIPVESSTDHFLASTTNPAAIEMWQGLNAHIAVIDRVGRIASQFGPRIGPFPIVTEYSLAQGHLLEDRALMATDGPLVADSAAFRRPDPAGHRTSPWFRLPLKLHSVASAQTRYNTFAADEHDRVHGGPQESWIDENGQAHEKPRPTNPYREKASAR